MPSKYATVLALAVLVVMTANVLLLVHTIGGKLTVCDCAEDPSVRRLGAGPPPPSEPCAVCPPPVTCPEPRGCPVCSSTDNCPPCQCSTTSSNPHLAAATTTVGSNPAPAQQNFVSLCMATIPREIAGHPPIDYLTETLESYQRQFDVGGAHLPATRVVVMNMRPGKHSVFSSASQQFGSDPRFVFAEHRVPFVEPSTTELRAKLGLDPAAYKTADLHIITNRDRHLWDVIPNTDVSFFDLQTISAPTKEELISKARDRCGRRQTCAGFIAIVDNLDNGRVSAAAYLKKNVNQENRKPFNALGVPVSVARQSHDLIQLTHLCAQNSEYIVYVEDDFTLCPYALTGLYSNLMAAPHCPSKRDFSTISMGKGMNGVALQSSDALTVWSEYLGRNMFRSPPDWLVYDPWKNPGAPKLAPRLFTKYVLWNHIGRVSSFSFRNSDAFVTSFQRSRLRAAKCYQEDIAWKHTALDDPGVPLNIRCLPDKERTKPKPQSRPAETDAAVAERRRAAQARIQRKQQQQPQQQQHVPNPS